KSGMWSGFSRYVKRRSPTPRPISTITRICRIATPSLPRRRSGTRSTCRTWSRTSCRPGRVRRWRCARTPITPSTGSACASSDTEGCGRTRSDAEAAVPGGVVAQRSQEVDTTELRPVGLGEPDLRVGRLPQQEAGETLFARRPDDEVGVGLPRGVEVAAHTFHGDRVDEVLPAETFGLTHPQQRLHRVHDLLS